MSHENRTIHITGRHDLRTIGDFMTKCLTLHLVAFFALPASLLNVQSARGQSIPPVALVPSTSNPQTPGSGSAVLSFTPALTNAGSTYHIEIIVRDSAGAQTRQAFDLPVVLSG